MLQEPKSFNQEPFKGGFQLRELFFRAVDGDLLGFPAVQGEDAHEGGGIDLEPVAAHNEPERLFGSQCYKILHIPHTVELNIELVHFFIPPALYKIYFIVYNGGRIPNRPDTQYYSTFL